MATFHTDYYILNKLNISKSTECGCFYCFNRFCPSSITEFTCDLDQTTGKFAKETAICPYCMVDAIIPNSVYNYTIEVLQQWHSEHGWGSESADSRAKWKRETNPQDKVIVTVDKDGKKIIYADNTVRLYGAS